MRKTSYIFLILLLTIALSACTLSANEPVEETLVVEDDPYKDIFDQSATQEGDLTEEPAGEETETEEPMEEPTEVETEEPAETEEPMETEAPAETEEPGDEPVDTEEPVETEAPVAVDPGELVVPEAYTIHKGESPFCIARRFDINAVQLLNYNDLAMDYVASIGVILSIPPNAATFDGNRALLAHPDTYTVQAGDNLYAIACLYGDVWPEEIAAANGLTIADAMSLSVGDVLQIP